MLEKSGFELSSSCKVKLSVLSSWRHNSFKAVKSAGRILTCTLQSSGLSLPLLWLLTTTSLLLNGALRFQQGSVKRENGPNEN